MVADYLLDYLNQRISLAALVDWAENVMLEGQIDQDDFEIVREIVARLGVADVKTFGLTWEDVAGDLARLGYIVRVEALAHA
jgi:hypothetical protein